jgi:hypothetical protein
MSSGQVSGPRQAGSAEPVLVVAAAVRARTAAAIRENREPEEDAVLEGSIDCTPYANELWARVPVVSIQVCPGTSIPGLDPQGLAEVVAKLRAQADLLEQDIRPRLVAAREDWAAHQWA